MMSQLNRLLQQGDRAADRLTKAQERELIRNYQLALKEVRTKIATAYEKYGDNYTNWTKYNRLATLEKDIGKEIGKLTGKNAVNLKTGIAKQFEDQYYRTAFALEKEVGARLGFGQLNPKTIEAAVQNPLDRVGFLQRNRDNQQRLARQMREQLTQGLIQGESYQKTARRIKERMDVGATNTLRIAQTENHRVQTVGRLRSFDQAEEYGVQAKRVWVSTLDDATRETHQDMDGQVADEDGMFDVDGIEAEGPGLTGDPAEDINCRCTIRMEIEGYEPKVRRAREVEGERGEIQSYKTYNEWKKGRID